ncbi:primase-helicase family protein [Aureispira sp. CCB-QB1]|uniref:primase-helicase family protein n=1 Tax=Aureispira sp. CCB-QB1 TaxID=1313421 RepID=UPI000696A540|nr:primase-helicase family protein [Aureispira sp. CCB-QB1]
MTKELLIEYANNNNIYQYNKKDQLGQFYALIRSLIIEWEKAHNRGILHAVPREIEAKYLDLATSFIKLHGFKIDKAQKEEYLQKISAWSLSVAMEFFNDTMTEMGADEERILTTVLEGEEEQQVPVFSCDTQTGNIHILVTALDGNYIKYEKKDINGDEEKTKLLNYELIRYARPGAKGKYKIPYDSGTYPFFPENIKRAYREKKAIDTLFITEGAKKAFKGYTSGGLYVVGLSSISHFRDKNSPKGNPKLHKDIIDLIKTCKVKNIVVLWDGDCVEISTKALELQQNIDQRPKNFFNYAKKIAELIQKEVKSHKKIYFSTIKTKSLKGNPKGLDDLLLWAEQQNSKQLKRVVGELLNLEDQNRVFTKLIDITTNTARMHEYFALHDVERFYYKHVESIEQKEFMFSGNRYIYVTATDTIKLLQPEYLERVRWIGDDFFELIEMPIPSKDGKEQSIKKLNRVKKSTLQDLYQRNFVDFMKDKHYKGFCNIPDHFNYEFEVKRGSGVYYNKYFPFEWTPKEGSFDVINGFVKHIFGDQYEMGLDYIQLLLTKPMQKLPVICLYSPENATGKSKFGELLSQIFKNNVVFINNDDLKSEFGLDRFADKLLAVCDETLLERKKDAERVKAISTAEAPILCNPKGMSAYELHTYVKLIFNSNNLRMIHATENDERFWIIRVPNPKEKDPELMEKMLEEIPAFVHFLKHRKLSTPKKGRMWFDPELIKTDTLKDVVRVNEHSDVQELRNKLEDYFIDFPNEANLMLSTKDIIEELMPGKTRNWMDEICGTRLSLVRYTNSKGKTAVKRSYILKKIPTNQNFDGVSDGAYKIIKISKSAQRVWIFNREDFMSEDVEYDSEEDGELTQDFIDQLNDDNEK